MRIEMLKGLSAITAAAVCAGLIVGFIPEPDPAAANTRNEQINAAPTSAPVVAATAACTQTWPYYEQSCLRDGRQAGRGTPTARVIPSSYPGKAQASKDQVSKDHVAKAEASKGRISKVAKLAGGSR
jgi:hypothetical protein